MLTSHDRDQTALGIERPKTGMFTFDKSAGKNSGVVCEAAHAHPPTPPPGSLYGELNLALWRAPKGGGGRRAQKNRPV